jgi:FKBP-type peptidyl-prolyl cis-trans isomerase FklB
LFFLKIEFRGRSSLGVCRKPEIGYAYPMKHIYTKIILAAFACALVLGACKGGKSGSIGEANFDKDASYSLGMDMGSALKNMGIVPDFNELVVGMKDVIGNAETRFTMEEAYTKLNESFQAMREKEAALREEQNETVRQAGIDFLLENSKKEGVQLTPSGLQYEVVIEGTGAKPLGTDVVKVHYEGTLPDGTVFDSSYTREEPTQFPLNGVIAGWTEGLQLMSVGSTYNFYIPFELGYGESGGGPMIPPYSALVFKVELLEIVR